MTLVLATCASLPDLDLDDQRLFRALQLANVPVEIAVWDDPSVNWARYELCVIRSTWDYVPKREQYVQWAEHVAGVTHLCNPAPVIRWNTDKIYLRELENQGIPIVETVWLKAGDAVDFVSLLQEKGWTVAVVKPVVSASGKNTFRVAPETLPVLESDLQQLLEHADLMVQPLMRSVFTTGELSFLFFNGEFSHAVAKRPATGEFRVQEHLGGVFHAFHPTESQVQAAEQVIRQLPWSTLYARVDFMADEAGNLRLSELELTEPSMYLSMDGQATDRFVRAIQDKLDEIKRKQPLLST